MSNEYNNLLDEVAGEPVALEWLKRFARLAVEKAGKVTYRENDDFGFVALTFLSRQLDHVLALLLLQRHNDVALVARSMLEGFGLLVWIAKDAENRAHEWRAFSIIHDWRLAKAKDERGEEVATEIRTEINTRLAEVEDRFLTNAARTARAEGNPMPDDPYMPRWPTQNIREVFEEAGLDRHYRLVYPTLCEWAHWATAGLGATLLHTDDGVRQSVCGWNAERIYPLALETLRGMLAIVDLHSNLGLRKEIETMTAQFIAEMQRGNVSQRT